MSGNNEAAAELFLLLAGLWKPPDEDYWQDVHDGRTDDELIALSRQAGHSTWWEAGALKGKISTLARQRAFYLRYFLGIGMESALPVESVYKKWTEDASVKIPIASNAGYLMGDSALHVKYLFDHYGLSAPKDYEMMPDHIALLFELAAFLVDERPVSEAKQFCEQHFDWLAQLEEALCGAAVGREEDQQTLGFYLEVLDASRKAVAAEVQRYSAFEE